MGPFPLTVGPLHLSFDHFLGSWVHTHATPRYSYCLLGWFHWLHVFGQTRWCRKEISDCYTSLYHWNRRQWIRALTAPLAVFSSVPSTPVRWLLLPGNQVQENLFYFDHHRISLYKLNQCRLREMFDCPGHPELKKKKSHRNNII